MLRLQDRIGQLHEEIDDERVNLKELHKERVRLNREHDERASEIEMWTNKCNNIQMLKFGRIIDLDVIEAGSDRSKEIEAEKGVKLVEEENMQQLTKLQASVEELTEKLAQATVRNTELLNTVSGLTEMRLMITRELNSTKGPAVSEDVVLAKNREREERKRMKMYLQLQAREITALKAEITMLKRKDVPPLPTMVPAPQTTLFSASAPLEGAVARASEKERLLPSIPAAIEGKQPIFNQK
jgi:cilia- and flagella-associated protein 44